MQKINIYNIGLARSRICRHLLVVCLVLFALYPLFDAALDAYSDHLNHPIRMTPDDRMYSARHNDHTNQKVVVFHQVFLPGMEGPVCFSFGRRPIPADALKTAQNRFPLSSDLSPPFI
jgi:hypothetical protein